MAALESKSIDHTITDPPFGENCHRNQFGPEGGILAKKRELDFQPLSAPEIYEYAKEIVRVTRRWILVFCQAEMLGDWKDALVSAGARYMRALCWPKPDSRPQLSGDRPGQGFELLACAYASEEKAHWNGRGKLGLYYAPIVRGKNRLHRTQKPVSLMEDFLVDFTDPYDLILDPFCGAGSTGVACARMGRRFLGMELDPKYHIIASNRIEEEMKRVKGLFATPPTTPPAGEKLTTILPALSALLPIGPVASLASVCPCQEGVVKGEQA